MVILTGTFIPSVFLIYSENFNTEDEPIAFPLHMDFVKDPVRIDQVLASVVLSYPANLYTLEMIMYANEGVNEQDGSNVVAFGARDAAGNTIHTILGQKKTASKHQLEMIEKKDAPLHEWVAPSHKEKNKVPSDVSPVTDSFLDMLAVKYAMASSTSRWSFTETRG